MPTDEYKPLLDRQEAKRNAAPLIEIASPLLREVVNHACWTFGRCNEAEAIIGGENEDLATMTLYRHLIELVDGIEVLFRASCVEAAVPILRAAFEASLSLDYIFQDHYTQRSLCWSCAYIHSRIAAHERYDPTTDAGAILTNLKRSDAANLPEYDSAADVSELQRVLGQPEFRPIQTEFQRLKRLKKSKPDWFQLFDGPRNRRALSAVLDREREYLAVYSEWSGFSHAGDASAYIRERNQPQELAFLAVRSAHEMPYRAFLATSYVIKATRQMLKHFRNEENLGEWYDHEVRPRWHRLGALRVEPA